MDCYIHVILDLTKYCHLTLMQLVFYQACKRFIVCVHEGHFNVLYYKMYCTNTINYSCGYLFFPKVDFHLLSVGFKVAI